METALVDYRGQETAYRHHDAGGEGPTLLRVHSSGDARGVWRNQFRLASGYPVVALDLSDHDDSDDMDADVGYGTLSAYVDDAVAMAEETDTDVLVSDLLGGAVVLTLMLGRDLGLNTLVLASTSTKLTVFSDLLDWFENGFGHVVSFLHGEDRLFHTDDERLVGGPREAIYDAGQMVTLQDFLSCHTFDVRDEVSKISVPTLVFIGEYDRLTPPSYREHLTETVPDGELEAVEDVTHLAVLGRPMAFNEAMKSFLDHHVV